MSVQMSIEALLLLLHKYSVESYIGYYKSKRIVVRLSDEYEKFLFDFYFSNDKDYSKFKRELQFLCERS